MEARALVREAALERAGAQPERAGDGGERGPNARASPSASPPAARTWASTGATSWDRTGTSPRMRAVRLPPDRRDGTAARGILGGMARPLPASWWLVPAALAACATSHTAQPDAARAPAPTAAPAPSAAGRALPTLPAAPARRASEAFLRAWGDGHAEMSGYRAVVSRYGELRPAEVVLVYVTEPLDRRTLIKDDDAPEERRLPVLKLNASLRFQTGIYPYSVLTSVFSPVDGYGPERFAPVKVTLSAQEWCGHVFHGVWPGADRFVSRGYSYFASEGEADEEVPVAAGALYEDALLIQLRELDGPFAGGGDWSGALVPSLWANRRAHQPLRPVQATITRSRAGAVERFALRYGSYTRTFEVEREGARRVLGWTASDGEEARLAGTARLRYWELHGNGDERYRERLGLAPLQQPPAPAPAPPAARP